MGSQKDNRKTVERTVIGDYYILLNRCTRDLNRPLKSEVLTLNLFRNKISGHKSGEEHSDVYYKNSILTE